MKLPQLFHSSALAYQKVKCSQNEQDHVVI